MNKQTFLNRFLLQIPALEKSQYTTKKALFSKKETLKKAAVLIPLVKRHNGINIILTERALHLRHHPGEICFPGGKYEQSDQNLQCTALRETEEEIGILQKQVSILGTQPKLPTISGFIIYPYLGFVRSNHSLKIDKQEVSGILEVPLTFILNKANFHRQHFPINKKRHQTYCIPYQNKIIWGATAQILKNLHNQLTYNDSVN